AFAGGRLFGERHGQGAPWVLALHGWDRTHADFDRTLQGVDAVALDLPGFGATPPPASAWGSADYATAVADAIDEPMVILGHSLGGRVAAYLAALRPDLVRALVLTGAPLYRATAAGRPPLSYRVARTLN